MPTISWNKLRSVATAKRWPWNWGRYYVLSHDPRPIEAEEHPTPFTPPYLPFMRPLFFLTPPVVPQESES